jgi:hypothetical protein
MLVFCAIFTWLHPRISARSSSSAGSETLSADSIATLAELYTGFQNIAMNRKMKITTSAIGFRGSSNTPWYNEQLILGENVIASVDSEYLSIDRISALRSFEITLDADSGYLLEVFSMSKHLGSSDTMPNANATQTEKFLVSRKMVFCGPVTEPPKASLKLVFDGAFGNACDAKEIRAILARVEFFQCDTMNVWIIDLRGFPYAVLPPHGPGRTPPLRATNSYISVVDASTGKLLFGGTSPYNDEKEKQLIESGYYDSLESRND